MPLYALRHGATPTGGFRGRLDAELTSEGWAQMHAGLIDAPAWQAIVSSPLKRCRLFAEQLASQLDLPLTLDEQLRELDFGQWEGRSASDLLADPAHADALSRFWQDPYQHPPSGGENLHAFEQRVIDAWQRHSQAAQQHTVLLVCHAGVIRQLLRLAKREPRSALMQAMVEHGSLHAIPLFAPHSH